MDKIITRQKNIHISDNTVTINATLENGKVREVSIRTTPKARLFIHSKERVESLVSMLRTLLCEISKEE